MTVDDPIIHGHREWRPHVRLYLADESLFSLVTQFIDFFCEANELLMAYLMWIIGVLVDDNTKGQYTQRTASVNLKAALKVEWDQSYITSSVPLVTL